MMFWTIWVWRFNGGLMWYPYRIKIKLTGYVHFYSVPCNHQCLFCRGVPLFFHWLIKFSTFAYVAPNVSSLCKLLLFDMLYMLVVDAFHGSVWNVSVVFYKAKCGHLLVYPSLATKHSAEDLLRLQTSLLCSLQLKLKLLKWDEILALGYFN